MTTGELLSFSSSDSRTLGSFSKPLGKSCSDLSPPLNRWPFCGGEVCSGTAELQRLLISLSQRIPDLLQRWGKYRPQESSANLPLPRTSGFLCDPA